MKAISELRKMMPPELAGIIGCTEYNAHRAAAWAAVEVAHRMASAKLDRAGTGADEAAKIEREFTGPESDYTAACAKLERERRTLMCEPETKPTKVVFDFSALMVAGKTPEASKFNAKVAGFKKRRFAALNTFLDRHNAAFLAWARDETDANKRAWNKARGELNQAEKPFATERQKLNAERARLVAAIRKGGLK